MVMLLRGYAFWRLRLQWLRFWGGCAFDGSAFGEAVLLMAVLLGRLRFWEASASMVALSKGCNFDGSDFDGSAFNGSAFGRQQFPEAVIFGWLQ